MKKVAIVYWSGTGNTEAMAKSVEEGVKAAGGNPEVIWCEQFNSSRLDSYDSIAFGCPAMGDEQLEEGSFEPMFSELEDKLAGKTVGLFGSYEWNDGEWMRRWKDRVSGKCNLACEPVTAYGAPDEETKKMCIDLGKRLS